MDISLVAKLKKEKDFLAMYSEGDEKKMYKGKGLLFYSICNNDLDTRYKISNFLIDKESDVTGVNEENETLLHVLLSRANHKLDETIKLCARIIEGGADINVLDSKNRSASQYLINMKYDDEELEPLYNIWLSQPNININVRNDWGKTPIDIAKTMPYRKKLLERLRKYEV
jgi:uncharacterized protein